MPSGWIPQHGAAAVGVTAPFQADLIAIIQHRRARIGHHGQIRQFQGARVAAGDGQKAGGVVAAEQIQLRRGNFAGIPGEERFQALGELARIVGLNRAIAVALGQGVRGRIQVDKEAVTGPRELIIHDGVKLIADQPAIGAVPDFADKIGIRVFRLDPASKCAPEGVVIDVARYVEPPPVDPLRDPVLGHTQQKARTWG